MSYRRLFTCLGLLVTVPAYGQTTLDSEEEIDNIIVSAARSPIAESGLGSSLTVIDREQIELRQSRYVTDLLRSVPGFAVSQVGTFGSQTQVRVRGSEANHVLVLIDGVRANDPASGDEFRWELLSTSDIERIEIVRGPQSSLWGSDAVAAVVHVITRSGNGGSGLGAYAEGGSHDTANGGISGALGGDRWSLGIGVDRLDTDGTNVSRSGTEDDGSDMTTASLTSTFEASPDIDLTFGLRAVDALSQFDPVDFLGTGLPADGDIATESDRLYLNAGATWRTFGGGLVHRIAARYLDTENLNLTDGAVSSATAAERRTFSYQSDIRLGEDLLSLAVEHEDTRFEQRGEVVFGDPNQNQDMRVLSFIADYQGNAFEHLSWLLSARFDDNSDFDSAWSGRLSLGWSLNESTLLRGNIGSGRKAPTFIERFGFFPEQFVGNPALKPETSRSVEAGIDKLFMDGAFELQFTVYHQDLEDEIDGFVFDPDTFLFTAENVAGDSTRQGVEIVANYDLSENLRLGAMYSYTDSTQAQPDGSELREVRRPRHTGSVYGNYAFLDERARLTINADYAGESSDNFFPPFPNPQEIVTLDDYWLVDVTASFAVSRSTSVYLRANNLLDEDYEQVFGFATPGRSVYGGVRLSFGR